MTLMLEANLSHTSTITVTKNLTARAMGSGDMEVFATPAMAALMENAAMRAVAEHLPEGSTTVGGQISTSHIRPTAVGHEVSATATLTEINGKKLLFSIRAEADGEIIGEGTHLRFIVDRERFLSKL